MAFTRPCGVSVCLYLFSVFAGASSPSFPCRCTVVTHRALYVVLSVWSGSCPMHTYCTIMWLSTKGTYVRMYVFTYLCTYCTVQYRSQQAPSTLAIVESLQLSDLCGPQSSVLLLYCLASLSVLVSCHTYAFFQSPQNLRYIFAFYYGMLLLYTTLVCMQEHSIVIRYACTYIAIAALESNRGTNECYTVHTYVVCTYVVCTYVCSLYVCTYIPANVRTCVDVFQYSQYRLLWEWSQWLLVAWAQCKTMKNACVQCKGSQAAQCYGQNGELWSFEIKALFDWGKVRGTYRGHPRLCT